MEGNNSSLGCAERPLSLSEQCVIAYDRGGYCEVDAVLDRYSVTEPKRRRCLRGIAQHIASENRARSEQKRYLEYMWKIIKKNAPKLSDK